VRVTEATPEEKTCGQALVDAIQQCRRAAAALQVAVELESDVYRRGAFREVLEQLRGAAHALKLLS